MALTELHITHLRNIKSLRIPLNTKMNIISGINGSGKTSFLESIYLLSCGHSFRTRDISALISHGEIALTLFAITNELHRVSLQKSVHMPTFAKINGESCSASSQLAALLPCQIFNQQMFEFINAGASLRRKIVDWGLFHVEQSYLSLWKEYARVVKQRNSLLKQKASQHQLRPWNEQIAIQSLKLDELRKPYFISLNKKFNDILQQLTPLNCMLDYYKGWDRKNEGTALLDILEINYVRDSVRGLTHYGAHQADFQLINPVFHVKHCLSRGQQKIVLFALKFAQATLINSDCLFLIDDLTSELDEAHIQRLMNYISSINGQFFISAHTIEQLIPYLPDNKTLFLLDKGQLSAV